MRPPQTVQALLDRIDELERILGVDEELTFRIMRSTGCSRTESKFVGMLFKRQMVTRECLFVVIYGDRSEDDVPESEILRTHVCKARQVLKQYGITIDTVWGAGYAMSTQNKKLLQELLDQEDYFDIRAIRRVKA